MDDLIELSDKEFRQFSTLVYDRFGIHLSDQKKALVSGRLHKRLRTLGLSSFSAYHKLITEDASGAELSELINRISTNHTFFYREKDHFEFLRTHVLPKVFERPARMGPYPLRIWSAGCASGEEIYTVAMVIRDFFGARFKEVDVGLLATDVSLNALDAARAAIYPPVRLAELPKNLREPYFSKINEENLALSEDIRSMVLFKKLNLMDEQYPMKGDFDVVFCRNVMIYFDEPTRARLVRALYRYVRPGGYLFIGHSESLQRTDCPFSYVKPAIYRKVEA